MYKSYADVCKQIRNRFEELYNNIEKMEDQGLTIPEQMRRELDELRIAVRGCFS